MTTTVRLGKCIWWLTPHREEPHALPGSPTPASRGEKPGRKRSRTRQGQYLHGTIDTAALVMPIAFSRVPWFSAPVMSP